MIQAWKQGHAQYAQLLAPIALVELLQPVRALLPPQATGAIGVSLLSSDARNGWRKPPAAGGLCFIE